MWQGFVTVGRGELLLTLLAVALLMFVVGIAAGQIYLMIRRPAVVKPEPCAMMHCDDEKEMADWLRHRDYSLITNEILADLQTRILPRPLQLVPRDGHAWPSPEQLSKIEADLEAAMRRHPAGRHRKADGDV